MIQVLLIYYYYFIYYIVIDNKSFTFKIKIYILDLQSVITTLSLILNVIVSHTVFDNMLL